MVALLEMVLNSLDSYRIHSPEAGPRDEKPGLRRGKNRRTGKAVLYQICPFQTLKNLIGKDPARRIPG
jgi:hypothetical protein